MISTHYLKLATFKAGWIERYRAAFLVAMLVAGFQIAVAQTQVATGNIKVSVMLDGDPPPDPIVIVDKNQEFCGDSLPDSVLVVSKRMIKNAVVFLDIPSGARQPAGPDPIALRGNHCLLEPRVQTAQSGVFLQLNSADEITHNPHGWWNDEITVFNITLLDPTMSFKRPLKRAGRYRIDCDTHSWMRAYIWTFDHAFHGVTGADGVAVLKAVPTGSYSIRVWHEVLGERTGEIQVQAGDTATWSPVLTLADHRLDSLKPKTVEPWPVPKHGP